MLHELQVNQIELEMPNEVLRPAQADLDTAQELMARILVLLRTSADFPPHLIAHFERMADSVAIALTRRQAMEALRKSEERFQLSMEATNDGLWDWNIKIDEIYLSPAYYGMLGYDPDSFKREVGAWKDLIHPDDHEYALRAYMDCIEGCRESFEVEYRMKARSREWHWVLCRGKCIAREEHGRALRLIGTHVDITDRKRAEAEKEKLEALNRNLQKSESLGRMAGAIAHHFNNQLQVVTLNLEMALSQLSRGAGKPVDFLMDAMQATRHASEVSSMMLTYLGQTRGRYEQLELSRICRLCLAMLTAAMPKNMVLESDLPSPGPVIGANASLIQQILANLVTNAWEAGDRAPCAIHLSVKTVLPSDISDGHRFPIDWQPRYRGYACLEVADTGCGIAAKDIDNLFDPYFSSKFTGRGMGLPVVLGIVRAHEGVITVESEPGRGSIFRVYFPLMAEEVPPLRIADCGLGIGESRNAGVGLAGKVGSGAMLLVEDEENLRKVATAMLSDLGYAVLAAKDGVEAVELLRQHADEIRWVFCDLTMPFMDGWKTLTALRQIAPGIPVILTSGYSEAQVMDSRCPERPQAFLSKPYRQKELGEAIRKVLKIAI